MVKNPVTPAHRQRFIFLVEKWQEKLGLHDWRLGFTKEKTQALACVACSYPDRLAKFTLGHDWGDWGIEEHMESIAVHELMHVMLAELIEVCKNRDARDEDVASAEHRVVNVMTRLLVGQSPAADTKSTSPSPQ